MVLEEEEAENLQPPPSAAVKKDDENRGGLIDLLRAPLDWLRMLASETHWSFVLGVVIVNGVSQGLGGALGRVGTEYYMKDVQKVQPSESQIYQGIVDLPWYIKPLWGLLTDVVPILGYRRRPYLILAGLVGVISMLFLSLQGKLHLLLALMLLMALSSNAAVADVTIDACVAEHSNRCPNLAADLQSLCALSSSIGALLGYFMSGIFVHLIGPKGVLGLLSVPAGLVLLIGIILNELATPNFAYGQVHRKFLEAGKAMWKTLKFPYVWRPCVYMYLSIALTLHINEGMFYWFTDAKGGPSFSQEAIGFILSIGSVGSLSGAILYQSLLKDHTFRDLAFWTQLLYGLSGMLDLIMVLRLNLKFGIPDYLFVVIDEIVSNIIGRLKWMPLLVLSSKLCPPGIEGTFFALLMSIENVGVLSSSWGGGLLLHLVDVTRTKFDNLWLAILIRNILRLTPLCLLFLVPKSDPNASILPPEISGSKGGTETPEIENLELVSLVSSIEGK